MIVLWGLFEDPPMAAVADELQQRRAPVAMIDQAFIDRFTMTKDASGDSLSCSAGQVRFDDVSAMYLRPYDATQIPGLDLVGDRAERATQVEEGLMSLATGMPGVVVNRPDSAHLNNSKPAQLGLIAKYAPALSRPATLVTTCRVAAEDFTRKHGTCIVKSVSGHRSRVRTLTLDDLSEDRLESIRFCPVQLQQWVDGTDVRVHVVGSETFATQVDSDADDYRYEKTSLSAVAIPDWVHQACVDLTHGMGLRLSGVDLRRGLDGSWYCFEVNPSPAFTYYQQRTDQPIAGAIADLLCT